MNGFVSISSQIFIMFMLIMSGVFLYRIRWISADTNRQLSKIVISFVNPALMFYAYNIEFDAKYLKGLFQAFMVAVAMHLMYILLSGLLVRNKDRMREGLERYCCIYSNCAFIGIPLVQAVYGNEGVFYVTAYITVFNLLMWTHGLVLIGNIKEFNIVDNILKSPTIIATILGLLVFCLRIRIPYLILQPIYYVSCLNTPLAMIVSGVTMAQTNFRAGIKNPRIYLVSMIKLVIIPVITILILSLLSTDRTAVMSAVLVGACPVATASVLLSIQYGNDEEYASMIFAMTTVLSMITLPLLVLLGESIL